MKKGFTLVELAIVLVIIGMLISGVLVAQSMIQTTKIQAQVRQIGQFDSAINNFQTKYNSLPGDSPVFTNPGNGDGRIDNNEVDGLTLGDPTFAGESALAWLHLQQGTGLFAEFTFDTTDFCGASDCVFLSEPRATINLPQAILEGKPKKIGILIAYDEISSQLNYNAYNFGYFSAPVAGWAPGGSEGLYCKDILALAQKLGNTANSVSGPVYALNCGVNFSGTTSVVQVKILSQTGQ